MASAATLKRSESIADNMPRALRQSRYHMRKCLAKFTGKGKRVMRPDHLMDEMAQAIDDKGEINKVLESLIGYILCSTQVNLI